ncbi:MAG TPA: DUF58 domain-containing protein [Vicinamibacterales bacterium]|nr:DUF58 domain-containing protein [Vicinamibacterales bacterium]
MLDPVLLSAISDLEFVARVTVEGALSGLHRSPFHGYSAEFSQYRHYRAGDDLKYVDWKLFARTDRIYTKQFRETTNVRMQIALDASASMGYRSDPGVSKLEYARLLGAALTHLVAGQGDATGLTVFDDQIRSYLASRPGRSHLRAVLAQLANTEARGKTASAAALRRAVDLLRSRGVLVLISDLLEDEDAVDAELRRASRMGHDVSVFHVLTPDELEWRWGNDLELEDSETGRRVLSATAAGPEYQRRVQAFVERWRTRCTNAGIEYVLARTDAAPAHTLREYLLHRGHGALR